MLTQQRMMVPLMYVESCLPRIPGTKNESRKFIKKTKRIENAYTKSTLYSTYNYRSARLFVVFSSSSLLFGFQFEKKGANWNQVGETTMHRI